MYQMFMHCCEPHRLGGICGGRVCCSPIMGSEPHCRVSNISPCFTIPCTCALVGQACTNWGAQELGDAPQGFDEFPMLYHHGQPHILQVCNHLLQCCTSQILTLHKAMKPSVPGCRVPPFCLLLSRSYTLSAQVRLP